MRNDLERASWRKSSRSSGGANNCVEVALLEELAGIRDTKHRDAGHLSVGSEQWASFLSALKQ